MSITATVERLVPAPRERVWRALTTDELALWFWPPRYQTVVESELRVGGGYRIDGPGAGMAVSGVYVAVEEPSRLVQTWRWDGEADETLVTFTLADAPDGGTLLTIAHENFADAVARDDHAIGWEACLDRLPRVLQLS